MLPRFVALCIASMVYAHPTQANEGDEGIFSMSPKEVINLRNSDSGIDPRVPESIADNVFLVTPSEVNAIRTKNLRIEEAKYQTIIDPIVESVIFDRHLEPNESTVTAYGIENSPTAIQFIDATGEPWPIYDSVGLDGQFFSLQSVENEYKNSVIVSGNQPGGVAFATIYLLGEPDPITVKFVVNNQRFNPKVTVRIMRTGPNANVNNKILLSSGQNNASVERYTSDQALNAALHGITPLDAKRAVIRTDGALGLNVDGWIVGDDMVIRTTLTLFSPQYKRLSIGTGGYKAYRMPYTPIIYGSSPEGKVVKLLVGDKQ